MKVNNLVRIYQPGLLRIHKLLNKAKKEKNGIKKLILIIIIMMILILYK